MLEHTRFMARYNRWMNERLYACAAGLPDEERRRDRGAFFGSIHRTLAHLVLADKIWLGRFAEQGVRFEALSASVLARPDFTGLDQVLFDDFDEMRSHRAELDAAIEAWAAEMTPAYVQQTMRYASTKGAPREHPLWQALSHFFNHQTHHRGQVTTLLLQAGVDPGVTDLIALVK
ncbi:DinB family protein [Methylibium rhizosphaerae]|uniref:DinB family protein n=1 Tax=Methylibium rhizosphaerae TaxID=2570323 RepID=UPI00112CBCB9|nr:DinB family protein [Methylibium rhizosphaerae]